MLNSLNNMKTKQKKFKMPEGYRIVPEKKFDFDTGKTKTSYWVEEFVVNPSRTCYPDDWFLRMFASRKPTWIRHSSAGFYDKFEFSSEKLAQAYIAYHSSKK